MSATKIGTAEFAGRIISGAIPDTEPGTITLRQLYPHPPVDIGAIAQVEEAEPQLTIDPTHDKSWTEADLVAMTTFFTARFRDHNRLAALLEIAAAIGEARH